MNLEFKWIYDLHDLSWPLMHNSGFMNTPLPEHFVHLVIVHAVSIVCEGKAVLPFDWCFINPKLLCTDIWVISIICQKENTERIWLSLILLSYPPFLWIPSYIYLNADKCKPTPKQNNPVTVLPKPWLDVRVLKGVAFNLHKVEFSWTFFFFGANQARDAHHPTSFVYFWLLINGK